ncbi:MAG TPA: hypothetical protein DDZ51_09145 [Planctomycetaceae bacterium]|nr:hypothetical protein [Planctomycetaceae bacterium]
MVNEAATEEREPSICPICGVDGATYGCCEHLALVRFDDSDCDCTLAKGVFYSSNDDVRFAFDELYETVLHLAMIWLAGGKNARKSIEKQLKQLTSGCDHLRLVMQSLSDKRINSLDEEDFESIVSTEFYGRLSDWFKRLFNSAWERQVTSLPADDYLILHSPGLSWSGTYYWSTNGKSCLVDICKEITDFAGAIREVTQAVLMGLAGEPKASATIKKVEAWIEHYRSLGTNPGETDEG